LLSPKPALAAELSEFSVCSLQVVPSQPSFLSPTGPGGAPATHLADVLDPPVAPPYLPLFKSPFSVHVLPLYSSLVVRYAAGEPYPPTHNAAVDTPAPPPE